MKRIRRIKHLTKEKIRRIVDDNSTRQGRIFSILIQILIVFSLINYSISTLPDLSAFWKKVIDVVDIICYIVFTIEYFCRIFVAKKKLKYIFSFYGIVDLLAILPFLFGRHIDLRAIRALRVLRIVSALKLSHYNEALRRFVLALKIIKPELILFTMVSNVLIFLSASAVYYFENPAQPEVFTSIFDSLWWAVVTLTTVGYGDCYPITAGGRTFTYFILLIGLGIITIPTGLIASALSEARQKMHEEKEAQETAKEDQAEGQTDQLP